MQPARGIEDHDAVGAVPGLFERGQAGRDDVVRYRVEVAADALGDRPDRASQGNDAGGRRDVSRTSAKSGVEGFRVQIRKNAE